MRDPSMRAALFAFFLTRTLVFAIFLLGTHVRVVEADRIFGVEAEEVEINLAPAGVLDRVRTLATRGDAGWYLHIAARGYERIPFEKQLPHNWAFFPVFPMLWRAAAFLTGGFAITGLVLANVFFFFSLLVLHRTGLAYGLTAEAADRTVLFLAAFPTSYFFSLPMAESVFLLLSAGTFLAAKRDAWWLACILAGLAAATRFSGILLLPVLFLLQWQKDGAFRPSGKTLALLLVPAGLTGFMAYLHAITGNALAFAEIEPAWGRRAQFFFFTLLEYLRSPLELSYKWNFKFFNFVVTVLAFISSGVLLKRRQWAFGFYVLAGVILPLSSGTLQSMPRYIMVLFPIFFVLSDAAKTPLIEKTVVVISTALLAIMSLLCALIVTLALS